MMKSSFPYPAKRVFEFDLRTRMSFLRKYFAAILGEFLVLSTVCCWMLSSPVVRFYITENVWLLYFSCFIYIATYTSLLCCAKRPVIARILVAHIIVEACAVSIFVTYYDLMYFYKAIIISTCSIGALFFYTFQTKWDFHVWIVILLNYVFIYFSFVFLKALFGETLYENVIAVLISIVILIYQSYAVFKIMYTLAPSDYLYALINVHTLPVNEVVFSSCILKSTS